MNSLHVSGADILVVAIAVLWIGNRITLSVPFLSKYSIPIAVTGGLLCSLVIAAIGAFGGPEITFDMTIRDTLLMVFFTTIGISAKFSRLAAGGKALGLLVVCAAVFLVVQDVTGVLLARVFGAHPGYGLFAGSVSLAGGHGTAIAWGKEATAAGLVNAELAGIAIAIFGLVAGGVIGGPVAERLIKRNGLAPAASEGPNTTLTDSAERDAYSLTLALRVLLVIAVCLSLGEVINRWLFDNDIKLPGFLTAMLVGAFFIDLFNALVIKFFIGLPIMEAAPLPGG